MNCLKPEHLAIGCWSGPRCRKCKQRHHTWLHGENMKDEGQPKGADSSKECIDISVTHVSRLSNQRQVLLMTASCRSLDQMALPVNMKISILFIFLSFFVSFFFFLSLTNNSTTTRSTRTFYTPNESSRTVDVPFLVYSCVKATSSKLCLETCIANTFPAAILCIRRTV